MVIPWCFSHCCLTPHLVSHMFPSRKTPTYSNVTVCVQTYKPYIGLTEICSPLHVHARCWPFCRVKNRENASTALLTLIQTFTTIRNTLPRIVFLRLHSRGKGFSLVSKQYKEEGIAGPCITLKIRRGHRRRKVVGSKNKRKKRRENARV